MNLIFTCGGTGGHINPALAVAKLFQERRGANILFIGGDGMEKDLVPRAGFPLKSLQVSGLQRRLTPAALFENAKSVVDLAASCASVTRMIRRFQPDAIIGTGGYASFPALREGARLGIPTIVHESNAVPGLATRLVEKTATKILVAFPECREHYLHPERVVVTGTPVQEAFVFTKREDARKVLRLDDRPFLVSCWGSLGAREMNKKIARFMVREAADGEPFQHVHATGSFGWKWMPDFVRGLGLDLTAHSAITMKEYIYDMPMLMAAADLILCRGGAATISEVLASRTPALIVPSPNVTDHHQEKNAAALARCGGAMVLPEDATDGDALYETAAALLRDAERRKGMRAALGRTGIVDAAERIYRVILPLTDAQ